MKILSSLIQTAFSENRLRAGLRGLSVVQNLLEDEHFVDDFLATALEYLRCDWVYDAAYCLQQIAFSHYKWAEKIVEILFTLLWHEGKDLPSPL
jgi:hypothetical protein